jgi:hypothetical protein
MLNLSNWSVGWEFNSVEGPIVRWFLSPSISICWYHPQLKELADQRYFRVDFQFLRFRLHLCRRVNVKS